MPNYRTLTPLLGLVVLTSPGLSQAHNDHAAYAMMQNCLASAEAPGNLASGLDLYCIDSYLATRPAADH
jgi:hypothetical protein